MFQESSHLVQTWEAPLRLEHTLDHPLCTTSGNSHCWFRYSSLVVPLFDRPHLRTYKPTTPPLVEPSGPFSTLEPSPHSTLWSAEVLAPSYPLKNVGLSVQAVVR